MNRSIRVAGHLHHAIRDGESLHQSIPVLVVVIEAPLLVHAIRAIAEALRRGPERLHDYSQMLLLEVRELSLEGILDGSAALVAIALKVFVHGVIAEERRDGGGVGVAERGPEVLVEPAQERDVV